MTDLNVTPTLSTRPVFLVDPTAQLPELFDCADQRFRTARRLLACLEDADACDVRSIADAALLLVEDGCQALIAMDAILQRTR